MLTIVNGRPNVTPLTPNSSARPLGAGRLSTPDEVNEFRSLLRQLDRDLPEREGWHRVRCWHAEAHAHGDRDPSMSVNTSLCWFVCRGCGIRGGLAALRRTAGTSGPAEGAPALFAALDALALLGSFGSELLGQIPPEALDALRSKTGRHKRDRPLEANLRTLLAAVAERMTLVGRTVRVQFSALDAHAAGIRPNTWCDLLDLLPHLGIEVHRGQSGRCIGRGVRGRGRGGMLAATELSVVSLVWLHPIVKGERMSIREGKSRGISREIPADPSATLRAARAVRAPLSADDRPSLSRRPAVARLLADLETAPDVLPAAGGRIIRPGSLTLAALVQTHGRSVRRTVRTAELLGLVEIVRVARTGTSSRAGWVELSDLGREVLAADSAAGAARLTAEVFERRRRWHDHQRRILSERSERARCRAVTHAGGALAPWAPHAHGYVRHVQTGEVVSLVTLRGGVDHTATNPAELAKVATSGLSID